MQAQVTKAAKRAAKRAQIVQVAKSEANQSKPTFGLEPTISKSALRRRKRKMRDEEVLGKGGLDGIKEQIEDLEEDDGDEEDGMEDPFGLEGHEVPTPHAASASSAAAAATSSNNKVGSKLRKRVLAQEQLRQPHILRDLRGAGTASAGSGLSAFAAIREHAKNTMPKPAAATASRKTARDGDVAMS